MFNLSSEIIKISQKFIGHSEDIKQFFDVLSHFVVEVPMNNYYSQTMYTLSKHECFSKIYQVDKLITDGLNSEGNQQLSVEGVKLKVENLTSQMRGILHTTYKKTINYYLEERGFPKLDELNLSTLLDLQDFLTFVEPKKSLVKVIFEFAFEAFAQTGELPITQLDHPILTNFREFLRF